MYKITYMIGTVRHTVKADRYGGDANQSLIRELYLFKSGEKEPFLTIINPINVLIERI
jgi:hypothetical protein